MAAVIQTLIDDFNDNSINAGLWSTSGLGLAESSQTLRFTSQTTAQYTVVDSVTTTYDLTGSFVLSELVDAGARNITSLEIYPAQAVNGTNKVFFLVVGTSIYAKKVTSGVEDISVLETYSATGHRWLRVREYAGTIYWDKSTNGIDWVNVTSASSTFAVTSLTVELSVGTWQNEAATTTVILDNFNLPPTAPNPLFNVSVGPAGPFPHYWTPWFGTELGIQVTSAIAEAVAVVSTSNSATASIAVSAGAA